MQTGIQVQKHRFLREKVFLFLHSVAADISLLQTKGKKPFFVPRSRLILLIGRRLKSFMGA
jgi:hypothetical protein